MSWYYSYYIGFEEKETGKIKPLGPYDCYNQLIPVIQNSKSYTSDITDYFSDLPKEKTSEELREKFEYENWKGEKITNLRYAYINELPSTDFIVRKYFLNDDLKNFEEDEDSMLFYNAITPQMYIELTKKELKFGKNKPKKDIEGYEYTEPNASDYRYDAIPNYRSKEYDSFLIHKMMDILLLYNYNIEANDKIVVIESQG